MNFSELGTFPFKKLIEIDVEIWFPHMIFFFNIFWSCALATALLVCSKTTRSFEMGSLMVRFSQHHSSVGRRWYPEKGMVNRLTANLYINQLSWALRTHHWKGNIYFWLPFPNISPCAISATNMHHSCWFTDRSVRRYVRCLCLGVSHSCILVAFKGGIGGFQDSIIGRVHDMLRSFLVIGDGCVFV